jgi:hypothetical protein
MRFSQPFLLEGLARYRTDLLMDMWDCQTMAYHPPSRFDGHWI